MEFKALHLNLPPRVRFEALASKFQQQTSESLCVVNGSELTTARVLSINLRDLVLESTRKNEFGLTEYDYRHPDETVYCFFSPLNGKEKVPDIVLSNKDSTDSYEDTKYF
jgi:hypothetical protein